MVVETNSAPGINEGTIFRPEDLGYGKKYPIYVWGNGACNLNGTDNSAALAQIASHGYFVISDGKPDGSGARNMDINSMRAPALKYISWIIAENRKPCSAYYNSIDTTKVAGNGFSCGGYLGMGIASDPRTTTWGVSSSGSFGDNPELWNSVHTPVLILEGNKDVPPGGTGAYNNGLRDYNGIAPKGHPIMFFSNKNMGHGGDLWAANGGDFTRINLAWLNWWLKGDTGATGKKVLVGPDCRYCTDSNWEVKSANIP
ncbi:MAG: alpha/beta hydrolase [Fibrobacter sp.]|nr:alpha/beta hydrolase [Fibrobacter sp.]